MSKISSKKVIIKSRQNIHQKNSSKNSLKTQSIPIPEGTSKMLEVQIRTNHEKKVTTISVLRSSARPASGL
jgi:hypothetical protein